ncbi:MAG: GIY-YIG nuclease family protein [Pseudomonadota bacterium]
MPRAYVYILTNRPNGVLYTGVTNDLRSRIDQHRKGDGSRFAGRYNCRRLVWAELHARIDEAIVREKRIKKWKRAWKVRLIEEGNPDWRDLADDLHMISAE